ncbi:MAG: helix-turn-helix transcriptional regulator [Methanocorpusculum parvum]|nr:helix-turn-helix transcriptional regulator [Methanocorpusculum parvum]
MLQEEDNVVVLEQGSVPAQKIAKAMASPTAGDLFNTLSDGPLTATALAERTGFPLTTVKYHLNNLLDADLIEVVDSRWSEKGREMKIYGVKDQVVVLAPRKRPDVRQIVERYGVIAGAVTIGCGVVLAIPNMLSRFLPQQNPGISLAREITEAAPAFDWMAFIQNATLIFFVGAIIVLAGMMIFEIYRTKKHKV